MNKTIYISFLYLFKISPENAELWLLTCLINTVYKLEPGFWISLRECTVPASRVGFEILIFKRLTFSFFASISTSTLLTEFNKCIFHRLNAILWMDILYLAILFQKINKNLKCLIDRNLNVRCIYVDLLLLRP